MSTAALYYLLAGIPQFQEESISNSFVSRFMHVITFRHVRRVYLFPLRISWTLERVCKQALRLIKKVTLLP